MTILTMAIADALAIAILCTLYLVRHRNREMMISYAVINAGIFTVSVALVSAGSNASAMGMGLFGVLSIFRHDRRYQHQPSVHRLHPDDGPGGSHRNPGCA